MYVIGKEITTLMKVHGDMSQHGNLMGIKYYGDWTTDMADHIMSIFPSFFSLHGVILFQFFSFFLWIYCLQFMYGSLCVYAKQWHHT